MSQFLKICEKIKKELLSEQEQQPQSNEMETAPVQGLDQEEEPTISNDETSEIKTVEEDSIKVDWVKKIIKLLTLLNREDDNVENIVSRLTDGEVNADTLKAKEGLIDELIRTIPTDKIS